ncbi:hypothetical protein QN355_06470 [Cryobacterium sp. 10S3]|nr:hypothetical protein [Cryobacterium sp. 10S3]MEB0286193.1 hypothetical protein [Cryobacterium sp. 10S3]WPX12251.1 hypothetical protein RHM57_11210 [Cryobacterium sp. 10S3]
MSAEAKAEAFRRAGGALAAVLDRINSQAAPEACEARELDRAA